MKEVREFIKTFMQIFMPCLYCLVALASFVGSLLILAEAPMWAFISLIVIIPIGAACTVRVCKILEPYFNN